MSKDHHDVICLFVSLSFYDIKRSEQVNRKCRPRNIILQLLTRYTDPTPSNSPPPDLEMLFFYIPFLDRVIILYILLRAWEILLLSLSKLIVN